MVRCMEESPIHVGPSPVHRYFIRKTPVLVIIGSTPQ
jgi:hypothetical protein